MNKIDAGPPLTEIIRGTPGFSGIFVDADHTYASVVKDAQLAATLLAPGGWMAFHDALKPYTSEVMPGCRAVSAIEHFNYVGAHHSILLLQKTAAGEQAVAWREAGRIQRHAHAKKIYVTLANSPLRKPFFAAVRLAQRLAS